MLINSISPSFYQRNNANLSKVNAKTSFGMSSTKDEATKNQMLGQIKAMEFQNEDERIANLNNIAIEFYNKKPDINGMILINSAVNYIPAAGKKRDAFVVELMRLAKYSYVLDKAQETLNELKDNNFGANVRFSISKYQPTSTNVCGIEVSNNDITCTTEKPKSSFRYIYMVSPKKRFK